MFGYSPFVILYFCGSSFLVFVLGVQAPSDLAMPESVRFEIGMQSQTFTIFARKTLSYLYAQSQHDSLFNRNRVPSYILDK